MMEMNLAGVSFHGTAFIFQLQCCHIYLGCALRVIVRHQSNLYNKWGMN